MKNTNKVLIAFASLQHILAKYHVLFPQSNNSNNIDACCHKYKFHIRLIFHMYI